MRSFKEYIADKEYRRTGGTPENAPFHSKNYRKYFEGYSEYVESDASGKKMIRRIYTGVLHSPDLSPVLYLKIKFLYFFLFPVGLFSFFYAAIQPVTSNFSLITTVLEACCVLCYGKLGWYLFNYSTNKTEMTLMEYQYTVAVRSMSLHTAAALICVFLSTLYHYITHSSEALDRYLFCLVLLAFSTVICIVIHLIESKISYRSFLSNHQAPADSCYLSK